MKSQKEIQEELEKTYPYTDEGRSKFHGMTYEQGVQAALEWVLDDDDDENPME